jgi:hypothetical protein
MEHMRIPQLIPWVLLLKPFNEKFKISSTDSRHASPCFAPRAMIFTEGQSL